MVTNEKERERKQFAARLNLALDEFGVPPKGKGRQTVVAKMFDVSQKGARKWLEGEGMPDTTKIPEIARRLGVRADWLLTGQGPMREEEKEKIEVETERYKHNYDEALLKILLHYFPDASVQINPSFSLGDKVPHGSCDLIIGRIGIEVVRIDVPSKKRLDWIRAKILELAAIRQAGHIDKAVLLVAVSPKMTQFKSFIDQIKKEADICDVVALIFSEENGELQRQVDGLIDILKNSLATNNNTHMS